MATVQAFNDVKDKPIRRGGDLIHGQRQFGNVGEMGVGYGSQVFRADRSGIWLGAQQFSNAPFKVDMQGNVTATTATLGQYISKTGTGQSFTGDFDVGAGNVSIDGANKRILINDGTNDRVLIGFDSGGF